MPHEEPSEQATDEAARTHPPEAYAETLPGKPLADSGYVPDVPNELRDHSRYRVIRLIGRGGMGAVYQAMHKVMDRFVALKIMRHELTENPAAIDRFRREVKAAAHLTHANIVAAFDAEQVGSTHFLVMEYVDGRSLADIVASDGPMPVTKAVECICQAAEGLQHAFEKGMIHRDIKPHNLILTTTSRGDTVKILDFGLARFAHEQGGSNTTSGVILGTVDFMAPEQADNARTADIRSDIYSLGCTFYYLLAGRVPFPEGTLIQRVMAHVERTPPAIGSLRPGLPAGLSEVLERMLAKDPADRFQTPTSVIEALEPFRGNPDAPLPESPATVLPAPVVLEAIPVHPSDVRPKSRPRRIEPIKLPLPAPSRTGRTLFGCFLLIALMIISVVGLAGYGIYLIVDRIGSGVDKFIEDSKQAQQTWDRLEREFTPPSPDAANDELFPKAIKDFNRREVDALTKIEELSIDLKGRRAVFGKGAQDVQVLILQPMTKLEKEAIYQRAIDAAERERKSGGGGIIMTNGSKTSERLSIQIDRPGVLGKGIKVRVQMWWNRNCLIIVRSPTSVDPEPLMLDYVQWLNRKNEASPVAPK